MNENIKTMKILKNVFLYMCGLFTAAIYLWMSPNYGAVDVYKENIGLIVKAHMFCYEGIIANWAEQDSTYIPLDSLEQEYLKVCGPRIDSIMQE